MNPQQPTDNVTPNPAVVVGQGAPVSSEADLSLPPQPSNGSSKTMMRAIVIVVVAVVLVGAFYVYALVANNPNRLWSESVSHTNRLATDLTNFYGNPNSNGYDYTGSFSNQTGSTVQKGTETGSTNDQGNTQTVKYSIGGSNVTIDTIEKNVSGSLNPDAYYRMSGVKALEAIFQGTNNASDFTANANQVDSKWFLLDHATLNNLQVAVPFSINLPLPDASNKTIVSKVSSLNQQYLFTSDASKAILTNRVNVGAETSNKRAVYHYKFSFNTDHYKQYVAALTTALGQQSLSGNNVGSLLGLDTMDNGLSTVKQSATVDVWIDKGSKTISKIHVPIINGGNNYVETGFAHENATTSPFYVTISSDNSGTTSVLSSSIGLNSADNSLVYGSKLSGTGSGAAVTSSSTTITSRKSALALNAPTGATNYNDEAAALNSVLSGVFGTSNTQAQ